jgi:hypothetical protein
MEEESINSEEFCIVDETRGYNSIETEQTNVIEDIIIQMEQEEIIVEDTIVGEIHETDVKKEEENTILEKKTLAEDEEEKEEEEKEKTLAEEDTVVILAGNIVNVEEDSEKDTTDEKDTTTHTTDEKEQSIQDSAEPIQPKEKFNFLNFMKNLFK